MIFIIRPLAFFIIHVHNNKNRTLGRLLEDNIIMQKKLYNNYPHF